MQSEFFIIFYLFQNILTLLFFFYFFKRNSSIKEESEKYLKVLDKSVSIIFIKDLNGIYTYVNTQFEQFQGEKRKNIIGKTDDDLYPPDFAKSYKNNDKLILKTRKPIQFDEIDPKRPEIHFVTNKFPLFDDEGKIYAIAGITTDVSDKIELQKKLFQKEIEEKKLLEKQLKNSLQRTEKNLRAIVDNIPDWIIIFNKDGTWIEHHSSNADKFPDFVKNIDPVGKNVKEFFPPDFYDYIMGFLEKCLSTQSLIKNEGVSSQGTFYEEYYVPLSDVEVMAIVRNITDRKVAEIELKQRTKDYQYANKQLIELAYVVSHDLKAPLSVIQMMIESITTDDTNAFSETTRTTLEIMKKRVRRMDQLVNGILKYSEVVHGQSDLPYEIIDCHLLINEILESLNPPESLELKILTNLPKIKFDKTRIYQIIQNLLSNAIKYNDKDLGIIEISHRLNENKDMCEFIITDNGKGIPLEYQDSIFNLFETGMKEKLSGSSSTGVGLSIIKKIIDGMGGNISVTSDIGKGTTFSLFIPSSYIIS